MKTVCQYWGSFEYVNIRTSETLPLAFNVSKRLNTNKTVVSSFKSALKNLSDYCGVGSKQGVSSWQYTCCSEAVVMIATII